MTPPKKAIKSPGIRINGGRTMKRQLASILLGSALLVPSIQLVANSKESTREERKESPERQRREEQKALQKYNKAVEKNGKDSAQAKKAWDRYQRELKEHGHS